MVKRKRIDHCAQCARKFKADSERGECVECYDDSLHSKCISVSKYDAKTRCYACHLKHEKDSKSAKRAQNKEEREAKALSAFESAVCMTCGLDGTDERPLFCCENNELHQQHSDCVKNDKPLDNDEEWNCDSCQTKASKCSVSGCTLAISTNITKLVECVFCHKAYHHTCLNIEKPLVDQDWACFNCEDDKERAKGVAETAAEALAAAAIDLAQNLDDDFGTGAVHAASSKKAKKHTKKKQSQRIELPPLTSEQKLVEQFWSMSLEEFSSFHLDAPMDKPLKHLSYTLPAALITMPTWPKRGAQFYRDLRASLPPKTIPQPSDAPCHDQGLEL